MVDVFWNGFECENSSVSSVNDVLISIDTIYTKTTMQKHVSKEHNKKWWMFSGTALNVKTHQLINKIENEIYLNDM